jgi:biopolymer transport protein TolR
MSMAVGGGDKGGVINDINVTPLVDVMLVLLIIMMIVAPLLNQGVSLQLPDAQNSSEMPETQGQTVLAITADGTYWVDTIQVPLNGLRQRMDDVLATKSEGLVIIKADDGAAYGLIMEALDELRLSGIEDIGLIAERREPAAGGE